MVQQAHPHEKVIDIYCIYIYIYIGLITSLDFLALVSLTHWWVDIFP